MLKARKKRKRFGILRSVNGLKQIVNKLPGEDECYKLISHGDFASISFILLVSEITKIKNMYVSTFRIGRKEILAIDEMKKRGRIDNCKFVFFNIMRKSNSEKYNYFDILEKICKKNDFEIAEKQNHSKVILLDTEMGKYVIETSSNLNENPKIEQFSFEKDSELYEFYKEEIFG